MNKENSSETEKNLRNTLKRCNPEVIEASIQYSKTKDTNLVATIVIGIIERFLEAENKNKLKEENFENYNLINDFGIDSLVMVEIVMTIEEVLEISIPNEDLVDISTIKDIKNYIHKRLKK